MVRRGKIKTLIDAPEFMEVTIYRNKVKERLFEELNRKRDEMRKERRYAYQGDWLTQEEIVLARVEERKENFTKVVLVIFFFVSMIVLSLILNWFIWTRVR